MKKLKTLILSFLILCVCQETFCQRPNIVVILADDIGVGDISCYRRMHSGNIILETPNIDSLARSGMVFTQAHSPAALCAPTRYSLMTGNSCYRSPAPWGVWGSYQESAIKDSDLTLGRLMQRAGYHTSFFGKWHLGGDFYRKSDPGTIYRAPRVEPELDVDISRMVDGPPQKGFDYSFTFPAGIQDVPYAVFENGDWMPLGDHSEIIHITQARMDSLDVILDKDEGLGDSRWDPHDMGPLLVDKAINYINTHSNQQDPFFMYYCSQAVHLPHTPPDTLNGVAIEGTTPTAHMDMIQELDVQMGMLVNALKANGVYENTVFIFTSDNGGLTRSETLASGHKPSSIFRGGKNSKYEGGHRVPFIVSWPDSIQAGKISDELVSGQDIMATLASITHTEIKSNEAMDSHDLLSVFMDHQGAKGHSFLLLQSGTGKDLILIEEGWKLIINEEINGQPLDASALFNLDSNPSEQESLNFVNQPAHRERVESMLRKYITIHDSRIPTRKSGKLELPYDHPHIYSEGRISQDTTGGFSGIFWPGSFVSVKFLGDSVHAELEDQNGTNYFNVIVDGEMTSVLKLEKGRKRYLLASGLEIAEHTVELHKRNDWSYGWTRFYGFELNGLVTYPQGEKEIFIEFYGNSITTGYGNEDYTGEDKPTGGVTNNYLAYGALTARSLGAEYSCISHSGTGIMVSWHDLIMPEEYDRLDPFNENSNWDFSSTQADYVVINLFQNDSWIVERPDYPQFKIRFGDKAPTEAQIIAAYTEFLNLIRMEYPGARIICLLGNMDITREGSPWPGYVEEAVSLAGPKIYSLSVPYKETAGHPKVEEQQIIADRLLGLISEMNDIIHHLSLRITNKYSGEPVKYADVTIDDKSYSADHNGLLSASVDYGTLKIVIDTERYADTSFTSTVGLANILDLPTYTTLPYEIHHNSGLLANDSMILFADSTLRFNFTTGTNALFIIPDNSGAFKFSVE